jgi:hypothetical protein
MDSAKSTMRVMEEVQQQQIEMEKKEQLLDKHQKNIINECSNRRQKNT